MKLAVLLSTILGVAGMCRSAPPGCSAPAPEPDIEWDKLDGEWRLILARAVGIDNGYGCISASNFRKTEEGFSYVHRKYGADGKVTYVKHDRLIAHGSGRFVFDNPDMSLEDNKQWYRRMVPAASEEDIRAEVSVFTHELVLHTDYDNYIMLMACAEDGSKHLWVFSRNAQPKAEDIVRIHNKLVDIGCDWSGVSLSPAPCWKKATA